jgi:hypothetical protein
LSGRFGHFQHVVRVALLFLSGFLLFLIVRARLVPDDFGVYGFYRAGALIAAQGLPLSYAGETACLDCHSDAGDVRKEGRHAIVKCEACHRPMWKHAQEPSDVPPPKLDPRALCLGCHTKAPGKPVTFPQIVIAAHEPNRPCLDCHAAHRPKVDPPKEAKR